MQKPLAYIDDTGLHLPDYPHVLEYLQALYRGIYGPDVYLEADSQDGQLCASFALALHDAYGLAGSVYNSFSPQTAQGAGLSRMVKINGIRRHKASYSQVDLRVVGQAGCEILNGVAEDAAGNRWLLPALVVIPINGEITVSAKAEAQGNTKAAPGEVSKIATPTRGWQSVENPLAAKPGAPVEIDSNLRFRQAISTALPSLSVFDGVLGAVASVAGVTRSRGYENDSPHEDYNGLPPHSISLVVEGGEVEAIALAIATKKTPGTGTYGDISVQTSDKYGAPNVINFFRAKRSELAIKVCLKVLPGYLASTGLEIKNNLLAYINTLQIGEDILLSKLYTPINNADQSPKTFDVFELQINGVAANLPITFNAAAYISIDTIEVVEIA